MIEKTIALPLRILAHSETSRIVTWLTEDRGRITTLCKGACRPKSPFLGHIDIPDLSELLFYTRDVNGLHIAKECTRIERRDAIRRDWRRYAMVDYVCRILLQVSAPGDPCRALYDLTQATLDQLNREPATPEFMLLWEMRLLKTLGMAPRLDGCLTCGRRLDPVTVPNRNDWLFSPDRGGLLCPACTDRSDPATGTRSLDPHQPAPPDAVAIMRHWGKALTLRSARRTRSSSIQCTAIHRLLAPFLAHHLDGDPRSRAVVAALLAETPNAIISDPKSPEPPGSRPKP